MKEIWRKIERDIEARQPEAILKSLQKRNYLYMKRLGSRFHFCGKWIPDFPDMLFESDGTFQFIEKGEHWREQLKKLKEQGLREVAECPS